MNEIKKYTSAAFCLLFVLSSVTGRAQVPGTYHDQRVSHFGSLPLQQKDIVFLGDSLTDEGEWNELFPKCRVRNRGISGDRTADIFSRLDQVTDGRPRKIFLMAGINDLGTGREPEAVAEDIIKIIRKIRESSPSTRIYVQSILPVNSRDVLNGHTASGPGILLCNQLLQEYCRNNRIAYIDLHSRMSDEEGMLSDLYTNDGVHLTGTGYMVWREVIRKYVK